MRGLIPTYPNAKISSIQIPSPTGILFMVESGIGSTRIVPLPFVGGVVVGVKGTANGDVAPGSLSITLPALCIDKPLSDERPLLLPGVNIPPTPYPPVDELALSPVVAR